MSLVLRSSQPDSRLVLSGGRQVSHVMSRKTYSMLWCESCGES